MDIVVSATPDQLRALVQLLAKDEYYVDLDAALGAHKRQSLFNIVDLATAKIDFIIRKSRALAATVSRPPRNSSLRDGAASSRVASWCPQQFPAGGCTLRVAQTGEWIRF
jgi:hypothetical protein